MVSQCSAKLYNNVYSKSRNETCMALKKKIMLDLGLPPAFYNYLLQVWNRFPIVDHGVTSFTY